jgi:hypothetical protein
MIFFSNDPYSVCVEPNDRRFCSLETDNRFSGAQRSRKTKEHFDRLLACPVMAVACCLYEEDISGFDPRDFPQSAFRQTQQALALCNAQPESVLKWLLGCLDRGQLPGEGSMFHSSLPLSAQEQQAGFPAWEHRRLKAYVYDHYKLQAGSHPRPDHVFWKELNSIVNIKTTQVRQGSGLGSVRAVQFPSLELCKEAFRNQMGHDGWRFESDPVPEAEAEAGPDAGAAADQDVDMDPDSVSEVAAAEAQAATSNASARLSAGPGAAAAGASASASSAVVGLTYRVAAAAASAASDNMDCSESKGLV